jgi:glycosyltransferase involved in cell wall biosynthesis
MQKLTSLGIASPRIRVAHLITSLNIGGAEQQMKHLVLASNCRQFEHFVVSMTDIGPIGEELRNAQVKVYCLQMPLGKPTLAGLLRLWRIVRNSKPNVLHCWLYHSCLLGVLVGRLARVPKVVWSLLSANEDLSTYRFQTRIVVRSCAILSRFADAIIPNSATGGSLHESWGYFKEKMRVIPNGVNLDLFKPDPAARISVREELGIPSDAVLIGLFARYHPMKDHGTFLRAARLLYLGNANAHFVLVGGGVTVDNPELWRTVQESGLQVVVHLLGPRSDIPRLMASLDIGCLSSWSESSPFVICEAMACGVPCVVTDVGDARTTVGDTGAVVPPRQPEALAQALFSLVETEAKRRTALGQKARERVEGRFGLTRAVSAYESLYQILVRHNALPANICIASCE